MDHSKKQTDNIPNTPSEIRDKQREIKDKIEELEEKHDRLGSRHHRMSERYVRHGNQCPDCGSTKDPKTGGFAHAATATCRDCGFTARCID